MHYQDVLICEANDWDRQVFSQTLTGCYISYSNGIEELNELLEEAEYDAIFFGRSTIIQILNQGALVLDKLSRAEVSGGLYMFQVSQDHQIQVKKISLLFSESVEASRADYYRSQSSTGQSEEA